MKNIFITSLIFFVPLASFAGIAVVFQTQTEVETIAQSKLTLELPRVCAGLASGDVLQELVGQTVPGSYEFDGYYQYETKVKFNLTRSGRSLDEITATVISYPSTGYSPNGVESLPVSYVASLRTVESKNGTCKYENSTSL